MGTDIHGIFQRHDGSQWIDVPSTYDFGRHYQLFAVLADVRNGYGFAGVKTGEPVKPIAPRRGLPPDFEMDGDDHPLASADLESPWRQKARLEHPDWYVDEKLAVWMGDHSHSWLTADEMLAWYAKAPRVIKTGILDRAIYDAWSGEGNPSEWCGGIGGGGVVTINDNELEKREVPGWTHIRCEWESGLGQELAYFFDEVKRLADLHGRVRFVFGFDS